MSENPATSEAPTYTVDELNEFRTLVELVESHRQLNRIKGCCEMKDFVERVGREKCDAMFEVLKAEMQ